MLKGKHSLQLRKSIEKYKRDSYLSEETKPLKSKFSPIDCEVGYSPFGCSKKMLEKIREFDFSLVSSYPEMFYGKLLKPIIIAKFPWGKLQPNNIFFGHGSFNLAERIIHKLVCPSAMLGYGPQFNEVPTEMVAAGGIYEPIPTRYNFAFPIDTIIDQLLSCRFSILYIDNPNNPTGVLLNLDVIEKMAKAAEESGTIMLIDEAYGDFVEDELSAFNLVKKFTNMIVVRSLSKTLGLAAQRIGYMAISDKLVPYYSKIDVPFEPTLISAIMAKFTLEDKDFINFVKYSSFECKNEIILAMEKAGLTIFPTHPNVSILTAYKENSNLFYHFQFLGISVENGSAYFETDKRMNHSFIRLRVPNKINSAEVAGRVLSHDFSNDI